MDLFSFQAGDESIHVHMYTVDREINKFRKINFRMLNFRNVTCYAREIFINSDINFMKVFKLRKFHDLRYKLLLILQCAV